MKTLIVVASLLVSTHVQAGFIAGYVVGSGANGSNKPSSTSNNNALYSDSHDVITCCRENNLDVSCEGSLVKLPDGRFTRKVTPEYFAIQSGYKTVHKIGFLHRYPGCDMIIMEVSK